MNQSDPQASTTEPKADGELVDRVVDALKSAGAIEQLTAPPAPLDGQAAAEHETSDGAAGEYALPKNPRIEKHRVESIGIDLNNESLILPMELSQDPRRIYLVVKHARIVLDAAFEKLSPLIQSMNEKQEAERREQRDAERKAFECA